MRDQPLMRLGAFVLATLLSTRPSVGQELREVADRPACASCEIVLEHVVTLGEIEGPGQLVGVSWVIERDSQGRYWVAQTDGAPGFVRLHVFDAEGRFLEAVGARGDGPGEFRALGHIRALSGDTVAAYDVRARRRTVLTLDGTVVSTRPVDVRVGRYSQVLSDGRLVAADHQPNPETVGYPLQLVDTLGRRVRSFGAMQPHYSVQEPFRVLKVLALDRDRASVWSIGRGDYLIERWDTLGNRLAALQREADWFEPYVLDRPVTRTEPPQPIVFDARMDDRGLLWTAVVVPSARWNDYLLESGPGGFRLVPGAVDTLLEVIDPVAGVLVASRRFSQLEWNMAGFVGQGELVVSYREEGPGIPYLDLWRVYQSGGQR